MTSMTQPPPHFSAPQYYAQQTTPQQIPAPHMPAPHMPGPHIQVVTTEGFPGRTIGATVGEVIGVVVREREIDRGSDPLTAYPAMLLRSRQQAVARMADMARDRGADAVVGLQFDSSEITQDLSEVVAYGTAVRFSG